MPKKDEIIKTKFQGAYIVTKVNYATKKATIKPYSVKNKKVGKGETVITFDQYYQMKGAEKKFGTDIASSKGDRIKGGLADNITVKGLAKKHGVTVKFIEKQLKDGIKVEMEHTTDKKIAEEIAKDHLYESEVYYIELAKMEEKFGTEVASTKTTTQSKKKKRGTVVASKQVSNKNNYKQLNSKVMAEKKKATKRGKVRTDAQLAKGSEKEKIYLAMRTAFNVEKGKGGNYAGSRLAKVKAPGSLFGGAGKKTSYYWDIDVKDPRYTEFKSAAKAALADIKAEKWSAKVAKAMDLFLGLQRTGGGRGAKTASGIQDLTF